METQNILRVCGAVLLVAAIGACVPAAPPTSPPPTAAATVELVLLGTTDVHGNLLAHDYYTGRSTDYGLSLLKPLIDSVRTANPGRVYLFDSGDLLQGNPLGYVYARVEADQPNAIIRAMNLLGYTASAIGNHEFNYGLDHLDRALELAEFPFVSANIFRHGTSEHAYQPYALMPHVVAEGDTLLIGVTGNTPPGVHVWDRHNVEGILDFRDVVASLADVVAELRAAGADLVVVLSHGGLEGTSYDLEATGLTPENEAARTAREVPGVDVIFVGHTHRELADTTINGVLLTQARNWARSLAAATIRLQRPAGGDWRVVAKRGEILRPDAARADTAFIDALRWEHERTVAYVNSVVGRSTARMDAARARVEDTPILDFVNEVQRRVAGADLSATAAFNIGATLPEGLVTVADVAGLYIYDNTLKAVRITGAELKAYLEQSAQYYNSWPVPAGGTVTNFQIPGYNFDVVSGVDYEIDLRRPAGERIVGLSYGGQPVRADQSFTLALNNYRQAGGGGFTMVASAPVVYDRQEDLRELLIEEIRQRGEIRPDDYFRQSWRIVPAEAAEAAYREQRAREIAAAGPAAAEAVQGARLRVVATNDFHGRLLPETPGWASGRTVGGAATLAAHFDAERGGFPGATILLDGGDVMQGAPISNLTAGRATIAYYNAAGYDAVAFGNHEFDWGVDVLRARIDESAFPWLAANVVVAGADTAPSWVRPTALLEVDGVRVGLIGLITSETPLVTRPSDIEGLEFRDLPATVDRWVPELRRAGADFVIVVGHVGAVCGPEGDPPCEGELVDVARAVRHRPDLMVGGHTHRLVRDRVNGIPLVEAGQYGTRYAVVDLERVSADSVHVWVRGFPVAYGDRVRPDSAVAALVQRFDDDIAPRLARLVATLAEPLPQGGPGAPPGERRGDYALGRIIADAQRAATGSDLALMNNGGIRTSLESGPLTLGRIFELQPFENRLLVLELTGAQVTEALEHALGGELPTAHLGGGCVCYDPNARPGARVRSVWLASGQRLSPDAVYTLTVNDFIADGGDGFDVLTRPLAARDAGILDRDALVQYLEKREQPVYAPAAPRMLPVRAGAQPCRCEAR